MQQPNDLKYTKTPYGDNLVARCDNCGRAVHLCTCDDEELQRLDDEDELYWKERFAEPTDAFGRNYSDADPGL
jgi:hypothetical protein